MTSSMQTERVPTFQFVGGFLCLVIAVPMTLVLVLDHFGGLSLPGCGEGGGCAAAARSWWGKVPGTEWPVSFVGLAYFTGLLLAWFACREGIPAAFRYLVRLGALLSVMFCVVMIVKGTICWYCIGTHAANLVFWGLMESVRTKPAVSLRPLVATAVVFVIATVVLGIFERQQKEQTLAKLDQEADESLQEIIDATSEKAASAQLTETTVRNDTSVSKSDSTKNAIPEPVTENTDSSEATAEQNTGLTGRYRWGPEKAAIRIVMQTDYQCPDCRAVELKAREILNQRDDVSLSIKHFPMDKSCNTGMSRTLHGNACWAARAAETAGILRGADGFFEMHHWLFDRRGSFTNQELNDGLLELGYDPYEFVELMKSQETLELVQTDIEEGRGLGLRFTPMIFINGVQLRGVFEQNASKLIHAVNRLAATNPPPMTAAADRPPNAIEKYVGDWQASRRLTLPPDSHPWAKGPERAKMNIVVWGDYQEKWTIKADRAIVKWLEGKADVRYSFRHFPFQKDCNAVLSVPTVHPKACLASQAAEAAGILGGLDGYWLMHHWLMDNHRSLNEASVRQGVGDLGFDAEALFETMKNPDVAAAIEEDCRAAKRSLKSRASLLHRGGIPTIYVNGKAVPWWRDQGKIFLDQILDAVYSGRAR